MNLLWKKSDISLICFEVFAQFYNAFICMIPSCHFKNPCRLYTFEQCVTEKTIENSILAWTFFSFKNCHLRTHIGTLKC